MTWTESKFSSERANEFRSVSATVLVVTGSFWQGSGWPDWNISSRHFHGWLELKIDKNSPTTEQTGKLWKLTEELVPAMVYRWDNETRSERLELLHYHQGTRYEMVSASLTGNPVEKLKYMQSFWVASIKKLMEKGLPFPKSRNDFLFC